MVIKGLEFLNKVGKMAKKPAMDLIKNSPIPKRWKKFLQGETLGEAGIRKNRTVSGQRAVVPYEISAFIKGGGTTLSLAAIYSYLVSEQKGASRKAAEAMDMKPKPKPKPKSKTLTRAQKDKIRDPRTFSTITVQKGDNITTIAKRAGVSKELLKRLNPKVRKDPNLIHPGQKIKIGNYKK
tara:strand:- start:117 stop:659 length:543 start_codon:yes stop_codon:yes gene_type:complete